MRSSNNYINQEDFKRIIDEIPEIGIRKWKDEDVQILFKIAYWCGLRINEGINLEFEDVDIENKEILLRKTKTELNVKITIPDPFVPELREWLDYKSYGRLFPGLTYHVVYKWILKLGKRLDIEAWTCSQAESGEKTITHIFRKSIGKDMLYATHKKKAAPINLVASKLRHKNLATTFQYLKVNHKAEADFWSED